MDAHENALSMVRRAYAEREHEISEYGVRERGLRVRAEKAEAQLAEQIKAGEGLSKRLTEAQDQILLLGERSDVWEEAFAKAEREREELGARLDRRLNDCEACYRLLIMPRLKVASVAAARAEGKGEPLPVTREEAERRVQERFANGHPVQVVVDLDRWGVWHGTVTDPQGWVIVKVRGDSEEQVLSMIVAAVEAGCPETAKEEAEL